MVPFSQQFTSPNPPRDVDLNLGNTVVPSEEEEEEYSCNKNVVIDQVSSDAVIITWFVGSGCSEQSYRNACFYFLQGYGQLN